MAIFNSSSGQTNLPSVTTIIAYGTSVRGEFQLKCNLHIDGEIEGPIETTGNVVIGKSGVVNGDIRAADITISGQCAGNLDADSVELLEGGKLFGKVISRSLVIEPSAVFEGESRLKTEHGEAAMAAAQKDTKLTAV